VDKFDIRLSDFGSVLSACMLRLEQCLPTNTAANGSDSTQQVVTTASEPSAPAVALTNAMSDNSDQGLSIGSLNDLQLLDDVGADVSYTLRTIAETTATPASVGTADSLNTASANNGFGRPLDRAAYTVLPKVLETLQVQPCDITRIHDYPIGRGGFAEVYKVNLTTSDNGINTKRVCAAKVRHACVYYHKQRVYIHILVHVCMLNTAAMLLVSKLACSESECIHNSCDITTTGCISERHVTAAATENLSKIL
jgi:hypothetical protein